MRAARPRTTPDSPQTQRVLHRGGRKRITGQHPNECPDCEGWGYTAETAPDFVKDEAGRLVTVTLGSGCLRCCGLGRLASPPPPPKQTQRSRDDRFTYTNYHTPPGKKPYHGPTSKGPRR